jgi:CubicO group peptidase (beta-lactamase class C family)
MTLDTIFDVASLTKVLASAPAMALLIERGQVQLDDPVQRFIPEFRGKGAALVTLRHLLTHTSGLLVGLGGASFQDYASGIAKAVQEEPRAVPGAEFHYCDLNFILLGEIVRRVAKKPLNEFVATELYRPLRMNDTDFLPTADLRPRVAPTQELPSGLLRGQVHDPTARRMGGVAGHAGVFSTAADLARFARMMLGEGELDGVRVFKPETIRLMTSVQSPKEVTARRGLGWDIDSGYSRPRGLVFPLGSYGHTGALLWIDPFSKTWVILLTNRLHPDGQGNVTELYGAVGTLAARAVEDFDFRNVPGALPFRTNFIINWGAVTNLIERNAGGTIPGASFRQP